METKQTNNIEIAQTIIAQIGGLGPLKAMTGAKNFINHGDGVSFRFPNRRGPNFVKITLDGSDTYTILFGSIRKYELTKQKTFDGVYCDQLSRIFENETGLYLRLV